MRQRSKPTIDQIRFDIEAFFQNQNATTWIISKNVLIVAKKRTLAVKIVHNKSIFTPTEKIKELNIAQTFVFRILKPDTEPSETMLRWAHQIEQKSAAIVRFVYSLDDAAAAAEAAL